MSDPWNDRMVYGSGTTDTTEETSAVQKKVAWIAYTGVVVCLAIAAGLLVLLVLVGG